MATKFYFHAATTTDTGTLPAAGVSISAEPPPTLIAAGGDTNRSMNTAIGAAQTFQAVTTNAVTSTQSALLARFCSAPIGAQTFDASTLTVTLGGAISESNTNSNFFCWFGLYVWRPSTGAVVGSIYDAPDVGTPGLTQATTAEAWSSAAPGANQLTTVSSLNNDILVVEIWRKLVAQGMSTGYTNTFFYDGTTEASATSAASFLNFSNTVTFASPPAVPLPFVHQSVPFYPGPSRPS